jgi:hypothetical protein
MHILTFAILGGVQYVSIFFLFRQLLCFHFIYTHLVCGSFYLGSLSPFPEFFIAQVVPYPKVYMHTLTFAKLGGVQNVSIFFWFRQFLCFHFINTHLVCGSFYLGSSSLFPDYSIALVVAYPKVYMHTLTFAKLGGVQYVSIFFSLGNSYVFISFTPIWFAVVSI